MTIQLLLLIVAYAVPLLFAIAMHETAHGFVARYFGDPTAADAGRLSLNPLRHIDPFGTILLPLALYYSTGVPFGYAKPVPVDFSRLRNPKKHMALVALAGPMSNFFMGLGWMVFLYCLMLSGAPGQFAIKMATVGVSVNAAMFVFNLIPIPPLDGGRIVTGMLPLPQARQFASIERHSLTVFIVLIVLMQLHVLDGALMRAMSVVIEVFRLLLKPFFPF
ncbi:MAG: site-2 protease family protein [Pseudomonadota bacterium]